MQQAMECLCTGGGYGTAGAEDDLALVEVGVRCSLEQVPRHLGWRTPLTLL